MSNATGQLIKTRREELGWTQDVLAANADTTKASISRYESGLQKPPPKTAMRIAQALKLDSHSILDALTADNLPEHHNRRTVYIEDPDTLETVEYYEGLNPTNRGIAKSLIQQLRDAERRNSIGGGSTDRVVEPAESPDAPRRG